MALVAMLAEGLYQISEPKSREVLKAVRGEGGAVRIVVAPWPDKDEQKWGLEQIAPATLTL